MQIRQHTNEQTTFLCNIDLLQAVDPGALFEKAIATENSPDQRGSAVFFSHADTDLVLKHYRRGGFVARFIRESYLYPGLERTRMWREFRLLDRLREWELPVPVPVAARCKRTSLLAYRGALITRNIPDTSTLGETLTHASLANETWANIGRTVADFHHHNIYHADLNANNILLDRAGTIHLIDFDKSAIRRHNNAWKQANLDRLLRSLHKLQASRELFHFTPDHWQALLDGYHAANRK